MQPPHNISDQSAAPKRSAPGGPALVETVLLVEDEDGVRRLAHRILEQHGYTVMQAVDGVEALAIAGEPGTRIDVLVTDVVMPRMGGRELALRLREQRPTLKVLFMSGYTNDAILRHDLLDAGVAFLPKPFSAADLLASVRAALTQK